MQLTPEIKKQLAEQKKQCVYCKIVSGEIPGKTVYQDKNALAILDIYPAVKGHTVFMPKEHYPLLLYMPPSEFVAYFGLLPALCNAILEGMVRTGLVLFLASGNAAGQQFPHVCLHILPRDEGDGFFNFYFKDAGKLPDGKMVALSRKINAFMQSHFQQNPASWHQDEGSRPSFLAGKVDVVYEDEKVLCAVPETSAVPGHLEVYSKVEERDFQKLSAEDSFHLFFVTSYISSAVFEELAAQGTNIIVKSGRFDDNPGGKLVVHIIPRKQNDSLEGMHWQAKQPSYNLDDVAKKIKDHTWKVEPEPPKKPVSASSAEDEIRDALKQLQKN